MGKQLVIKKNLFPDRGNLVQRQFTLFCNNVAYEFQIDDIIGMDRIIVFNSIVFILITIFSDILIRYRIMGKFQCFQE